MLSTSRPVKTQHNRKQIFRVNTMLVFCLALALVAPALSLPRQSEIKYINNDHTADAHITITNKISF